MKKYLIAAIALLLAVSMLAGCGKNGGVEVSDNGTLDNSQSQVAETNVVSSPNGDVVIYPEVPDEIDLYVDDGLLTNGYTEEDINSINTFVNGYAGIIYNVDENFTAEGIERYVANHDAAYYIDVNKGVTETLDSVKLIQVAFGNTTDTANVAAIFHVYRESGLDFGPGYYTYLLVFPIQKVDGCWMKTADSTGGHYDETQRLMRDSVTKELSCINK